MTKREGLTDVGIKPDPLAEEYQSMVMNIVSDDSPIENQLGHVLNLIYTQHRPELFIKYLDRFIGKKEREIEKICSNYSQQFIKSLDVLLEIQKEAITLKDRISAVNDEIQHTAKEALRTRFKNIQYNKLYMNLKNTLTAFESCHVLFEHVDIVQSELDHIRNRDRPCDYHIALRELGLLQEYHHESARHVLMRLQPWSNHAYKSIEQAILSDIRDWLATARQASPKLGQLTIQEVEQRFFRITSEESFMADGIEICDLFNKVNLNCETILKTIHMFKLMKREKVFVSYYAENRKFQAEIMLQGTTAMLQKPFSYFNDYICEILGFFVVEFFMMSSPYEFYPSSQVFVLWEKAQDNLQNIFSGEVEQKKDDSESSRNITTLMIQFLHAVDYFGFPASRIIEVLSIMFHKNMENIKIFIMENIHQRILEDTCATLAVSNSEEDFRKVTSKFPFLFSPPYQYSDPSSTTFPVKLPFTPLIPDVFDCLISLIDAIFDFAITNRELNITEYASKSLDICIIQHIAQVLVNLRISKQISYYVHVWLDLQALIYIADILEGYIVDKQAYNQSRRLTHSSSHTNIKYSACSSVHLKCKQALEQFQLAARQRICALLDEELKEHLSAALSDDFIGTIKEPIELLMSIWNVTLDSLPLDDKSNIMSEVVNSLSSMLLDKVLYQNNITDAMTKSLHVHVQMLQKLVKDIGWKEDENLTDLTVLSQLLELLKTDNPEKYLDESYRLQHYNALSAGTVVVVLEKINTRSDKSSLIQELLSRIQLSSKDDIIEETE